MASHLDFYSVLKGVWGLISQIPALLSWTRLASVAKKRQTLIFVGTHPSVVVHANRSPLFRKDRMSIGHLASILFEFYHCNGPTELLVLVTELYRLHMTLVSISFDHSAMPIALVHLGEALFANYQLKNHMKYLNESITYYQRVIGQFPQADVSLRAQVGLAIAVYYRYEVTSCADDHNEAMSLFISSATRSVHANVSDRAWVSIASAFARGALYAKWIDEASQQDIEAAISDIQKIPRVALSHSRYLTSLVAETRLINLLLRKNRQRALIARGLETAMRALQQCEEQAYVLRYQIQVEIYHLHARAQAFGWDDEHSTQLKARCILSLQLRSNPLSSQNDFVHWESNYHCAFSSLKDALVREDLAMLESAVAAIRNSVSTCPELHVARIHMPNAIAYALGVYYDHSGQLSALYELNALRYIYTDFTQYPMFALNVAESLLARARTTDVSTAISLIEDAIDLCMQRQSGSDSLREHELIISDLRLVSACRQRIELGAGFSPRLDIEKVLELTSRGLLSPPGPSARIGFTLARIDVLIHRARHDNHAPSLTEASQVVEQALLSIDSVLPAIYSVDLLVAQAELLVAQSDLLPQPGDIVLLQQAWEIYYRAVTHPGSIKRFRERFQACLRWASYSAARGHIHEAFKAYSHAIEILPDIILLSDGLTERIEALRQVTGLASASASVALTLSDIPAAIQFLELTRGILQLQSFYTRVDGIVSPPDSWREEFSRVCGKLRRADDLSWLTRRNAAEELKNVVSEIRAVPSFERFLLPPLFSELQLVLRTRGSYAVVIIPNNAYCDVVVLGTSQSPTHLRLTSSSNIVLQRQVQELHNKCSYSRTANADVLRGIKMVEADKTTLNDNMDSDTQLLAELWLTLVRPIVESMNILDNHGSSLRKQVWWCPVGSLISLPLHAAGQYDGPSPEYVGQYLVSSYVPTLTILHHMLSRDTFRTNTIVTPPQTLLISQSNKEGHASLPYVYLEAHSIKRIVPRLSELKNISVDAALAAIRDVSVLHFACHGHQDQIDPLNSGFELQDGRLTLGKLMNLRTPHAQLAYLSTCESASIDESRPDEGLNLASTMLFTGFRSVIATLWGMEDIDGSFMAERIYTRIFRDGQLNMSLVADAVDNAVRELRETGVPASRWATYVHYGV